MTAGALGVALGLVIGLLALVLTLRARRQARPVRPDDRPAEEPAPPRRALQTETIELLEMLRSATIVVDRSGTVLRASSSAAVLGLVRDDGIRHHDLRTLVHEAERAGRIQEKELELRRGPIGSGRIQIAVRVAPLDSGLTVVLAEDLTVARQLEETRRDFVVNVSHELKTPVGGLGLLAEAIEGAADDPEAVARFAARMKREAERLTNLVAEIIDLSRLQTHEFSATPTIVDVYECAELAVEQTRTVAEQRHITVSSASAPHTRRVRGDASLIVTAVRNLVANAIAYSDDRSRVSVVVRRHHDLVEISVSDQGAGIHAAEQARIFERFYRVDSARSRATGGTGLGLAIVKHICASHGGDVTVWSQEGQGSTFTIRLPAAQTGNPVVDAAGGGGGVSESGRGIAGATADTAAPADPVASTDAGSRSPGIPNDGSSASRTPPSPAQATRSEDLHVAPSASSHTTPTQEVNR